MIAAGAQIHAESLLWTLKRYTLFNSVLFAFGREIHLVKFTELVSLSVKCAAFGFKLGLMIPALSLSP